MANQVWDSAKTIYKDLYITMYNKYLNIYWVNMITNEKFNGN